MLTVKFSVVLERGGGHAERDGRAAHEGARHDRGADLDPELPRLEAEAVRFLATKVAYVTDKQRETAMEFAWLTLVPISEGYGMSAKYADQSALMLAARITLPHFSVSSAMSFPKSAGDPEAPCRRSRQAAP